MYTTVHLVMNRRESLSQGEIHCKEQLAPLIKPIHMTDKRKPGKLIQACF